jgi:hypothetical protein
MGELWMKALELNLVSLVKISSSLIHTKEKIYEVEPNGTTNVVCRSSGESNSRSNMAWNRFFSVPVPPDPPNLTPCDSVGWCRIVSCCQDKPHGQVTSCRAAACDGCAVL